MYSVLMIYFVIIAIHIIITLSVPCQFCRKIIYWYKYVQHAYRACLWFMLRLLQYTELLLYLQGQFCRKIIYCTACLWFMLQLLQYTELVLYLPSQFICKIIYSNKYVQRAYDLCCDYCDTKNYYSIYLVNSVVK